MSLRLILALMILVAAPAYAQTETPLAPPATAQIVTVEASDVVGTVLEAEGTVSLMIAGAEPKALKINDAIHMNDVIETGASSRAFVQLIDDTELTLGENAQMTIDEYVFDEENTAGNKGRYSIPRGAFLYTSGLIAKTENPDVTVNTPYGAIGIRGTTFWGGDIDGEYGVLVTEGRVSVQTERGRIFVDKGQGTSLRARTSIPSRPAVWGDEKTGRAVQTIALKNAAGVRERVGKRIEAQKESRLKYREFQKTRLQQKNIGIIPGAPLKRIDNAPRSPEQKLPQRKAEGNERLNRPFTNETRTKTEPLLNAPSTNAAAATPDIQQPIDNKSAVPKVDLPALGTNEAHTNELREQQDIQRRKQPMVRRQRSLGGPAEKPAAGSKVDKAF